jgi:hypothetical protein
MAARLKAFESGIEVQAAWVWHPDLNYLGLRLDVAWLSDLGSLGSGMTVRPRYRGSVMVEV